MKELNSVNKEQRVYVLREGSGYSCLGFDVVERRISRLIAEGFAAPEKPARPGSKRRYLQYVALQAAVYRRHRATGWRSQSELTPELIGKEGKRVEVMHQWKEGGEVEKTRFTVGKSGGWVPVHLQLHNRAANSGSAVCLGKILSVRVIS